MHGWIVVCILVAAFIFYLAFNRKCNTPLIEGRGGGGGGGHGGGGGGGRGGGGWSGGGGRGGGGGGRGGGGRGGRGGHGGHGRGGHWRGRGRGGGGDYGYGYGGAYYGPWWWDWWNDPYYYFDMPSDLNIDNDPCDCYGKYKSAMDAGGDKSKAEAGLIQCVRNTVNGVAC